MTGIDDPHTVDRIMRRPDGQYVLIIAATHRPVSTREDIKLLVSKLNAYASFTLDGGLRDLVGGEDELNVCFRIDVPAELSDDAVRAISYIEDKLDPYRISIEYAVTPG